MPTSWDTLLENCRQIEIREERNVTGNYFEAVVYNRDMPRWVEQLGQHLGPAMKPPGKSPSREAKQLTEAFGGIRKEQTLFYQAGDGIATIAMFWPWGDKQHSTLKIWTSPVAG